MVCVCVSMRAYTTKNSNENRSIIVTGKLSVRRPEVRSRRARIHTAWVERAEHQSSTCLGVSGAVGEGSERRRALSRRRDASAARCDRRLSSSRRRRRCRRRRVAVTVAVVVVIFYRHRRSLGTRENIKKITRSPRPSPGSGGLYRNYHRSRHVSPARAENSFLPPFD